MKNFLIRKMTEKEIVEAWTDFIWDHPTSGPYMSSADPLLPKIQKELIKREKALKKHWKENPVAKKIRENLTHHDKLESRE